MPWREPLRAGAGRGASRAGLTGIRAGLAGALTAGLLATVAAAAGCGGKASPQAVHQRDLDARYAAAERALAHGQLDAAEAAFTALAAEDVSPEAEDLARYRLASVALARGDRALAQARLRALAARGTPERAALARLWLLRLAAAGEGPGAAPETDEAALRALVRAWPDSVAADRALRQLAVSPPDPSVRADLDRVQWLLALAREAPASAVADNAVWWAAHIQLGRLGDLAGAERALRQLVTGWPASPLVDDALWRLAAVYRRLGAHAHAAQTYEALWADRDEHSALVGSYRSALQDDAALWAARVRHAGLRDLAGAAAAYRRLLAHFDTSVLRDDAWWGLACVEAEAGDPVAARAALAELSRAHPASRHTAAAAALAAALDAQAEPACAPGLAVSLADTVGGGL